MKQTLIIRWLSTLGAAALLTAGAASAADVRVMISAVFMEFIPSWARLSSAQVVIAWSRRAVHR